MPVRAIESTIAQYVPVVNFLGKLSQNGVGKPFNVFKPYGAENKKHDQAKKEANPYKAYKRSCHFLSFENYIAKDENRL